MIQWGGVIFHATKTPVSKKIVEYFYQLSGGRVLFLIFQRSRFQYFTALVSTAGPGPRTHSIKHQRMGGYKPIHKLEPRQPEKDPRQRPLKDIGGSIHGNAIHTWRIVHTSELQCLDMHSYLWLRFYPPSNNTFGKGSRQLGWSIHVDKWIWYLLVFNHQINQTWIR